jgi:hypothetical protein
MAVIGARELQPVNVLGSYIQGTQLGQQMRAQRREEAATDAAAQEQVQLRNFLASADLSSPEVQNQLLRMPGGAQIAQQAAQLGQTRATAEKSQYEMQRERLRDMYNLVSSATDPESYARVRTIGEQMGIDMSQIPEQYDPAFVEQSKNAVLTAAQRLDAQLRGRTADVQERQISLRERELERGPASEQPKPPQGYRYTREGDLEPIPGGPKDPEVVGKTERVKITSREAAKRDATFNKVNASYKAHEAKADDLITLLNELKESKGLPQLLGPIESRLPTFRQATADAEAKLKTIVARGQFRELQEMRNNSPTGGALGNVSNFEIQALQNAFAQLDTAQSEESFTKAIDRVVEELQRSKRNLREGFEDTYGYRENRAGAISDESSDWEDL